MGASDEIETELLTGSVRSVGDAQAVGSFQIVEILGGADVTSSSGYRRDSITLHSNGTSSKPVIGAGKSLLCGRMC